MTTPRIEKMVEHGTKMKPKFLETGNWVEYIVRYAHQAGIDEAVEKVYERKGLDDPECWHGKNWKDCQAEQCELRAINDTIKALQDQK